MLHHFNFNNLAVSAVSVTSILHYITNLLSNYKYNSKWLKLKYRRIMLPLTRLQGLGKTSLLR